MRHARRWVRPGFSGASATSSVAWRARATTSSSRDTTRGAGGRRSTRAGWSTRSRARPHRRGSARRGTRRSERRGRRCGRPGGPDDADCRRRMHRPERWYTPEGQVDQTGRGAARGSCSSFRVRRELALARHAAGAAKGSLGCLDDQPRGPRSISTYPRPASASARTRSCRHRPSATGTDARPSRSMTERTAIAGRGGRATIRTGTPRG